MAKFTKYNNPSKRKRTRKPLDWNDRCILAGKAMIEDRQIGIELPVEVYEDAFDLKRR